MFNGTLPTTWQGEALPSLLSRASAVLDKQALPGAVGSIPILPKPLGDLLGTALGSGTTNNDARQQLLGIVDSLLVELAREQGRPTTPYDDRVPLIHCMAPARAGSDALTTFHVVNEEPGASEIAIYATNFVADCGYEISSMHVHATPRVAVVASGQSLDLTIKIAVPQQGPAGIYSGLIQATGHRYVKAVVSLQVM